jgi:hypothetical protein
MDFSKTVIYHFVCKDEMIKCSYVGSTTNFNKRKCQHKTDCKIETSKNYHYKIYQTIREHGGWINWDMKPLEEFPCENKTQQVMREQYWIDQLKPELNCHVAYREGENTCEKQKKWREANLVAIKEKSKARYELNKDTVIEKSKARYELNKDTIIEKCKAYREANAEVLVEKRKAYREKNAELIKEKKSVKYTCDCGSIICINDKAQHERSMKHQAFIVPTVSVVE